jgi:molybdopterin-containing oxidoreductase family membrane subunit
MEAFFAWYSSNPCEQYMMVNRMKGPYQWYYWALLFCNAVTPQFLWSRRVRRSMLALFVIAIIVNIGMWLERFVIVITSLHADFLTSSWGMYYPTVWDWATYIGSMGLFMALLFLFIRFLPMISIFEMRAILPAEKESELTH